MLDSAQAKLLAEIVEEYFVNEAICWTNEDFLEAQQTADALIAAGKDVRLVQDERFHTWSIEFEEVK